jgi:hypothetical protein
MSKYETVLEALRRGERDAQLLDGRDFDANYWRNARRQLANLRRELARLERENEAFRAVIDGGSEEA